MTALPSTVLDPTPGRWSITETTANLAISTDLRSLNALHLAAALLLPDQTALATWDIRLHRAARKEGLDTLPRDL